MTDPNLGPTKVEPPTPGGEAATFIPTQVPTEPPGTTPREVTIAGRYRLVAPIGAGGMGSVWLADQTEPVKRQVALKLIKPGMDSRNVLARFEAERQALALMDHPNIARVLDGGMTDEGRPYFVMELVRGVTITDYCDSKRLTIRERLELFDQVCAAVQHAHQKGLIHRDLKPSNILVTEVDGRPVTKVIDFGLAKALQGVTALAEFSVETQFGAVVGTPLYMAPEQLDTDSVDIDTRADIYSLGVVLYELMAGTTPIERARLKQAAWDELCRLIREEEPIRPSARLSSSEALPSIAAVRKGDPSSITRLIRGDLDCIILKALEKDRNRRYETASALALDLQRHLTGEPVLAAPPSRMYRIRKFVGRNRGPVVAVSLISIALVGGIIGTTFGLFRAEFQRKRADQQRDRAEAREQQAIDAVKRFADAVANNPELKNSPDLEPLRKELLKEPLQFFQSLREQLSADKETNPESLEKLAGAATELAHLAYEIGDKQVALVAMRDAQRIAEQLAAEHPQVTGYQAKLAVGFSNFGVLLLKIRTTG